LSWFCRTPSILARSLMRDVAQAGATAPASIIIPASTAAQIVLVIPCSPRGSDLDPAPSETRAIAGRGLSALSYQQFSAGLSAGLAPVRGVNCRGRQILPGHLPAINHDGPTVRPHRQNRA